MKTDTETCMFDTFQVIKNMFGCFSNPEKNKVDATDPVQQLDFATSVCDVIVTLHLVAAHMLRELKLTSEEIEAVLNLDFVVPQVWDQETQRRALKAHIGEISKILKLQEKLSWSFSSPSDDLQEEIKVCEQMLQELEEGVEDVNDDVDANW